MTGINDIIEAAKAMAQAGVSIWNEVDVVQHITLPHPQVYKACDIVSREEVAVDGEMVHAYYMQFPSNPAQTLICSAEVYNQLKQL